MGEAGLVVTIDASVTHSEMFQHLTLLPKTATMSNEFIIKFRSFDKVKCCFDIAAVFGNNAAGFVSATMSNEILSNVFNLFRLCRKDELSFEIVAETGNRQHCCQKWQQCRKNIQFCRKNRSTYIIQQCCFDIVAGRWCGLGFYKVACCFNNVSLTLLLVWTWL